jgi:UDP-3-O-[3-hydroxymyristoyl] glucosamine N-acyltransferase
LIDKDFYKNFGPFSLDELALKIDAKIEGDKNKIVFDIASLSEATDKEVSFYHSSKYKDDFNKTKAGVIVVNNKCKINTKKNYLIVKDPYIAMAKVASIFYPECEYQSFYFDDNELMDLSNKPIKCSKKAFIHKSCSIGKNCEIGSFVKIGPGVSIGDNCLIGDNVSIYYSKISNNVKLYQGVKIGGEGFGFIAKKIFLKKSLN